MEVENVGTVRKSCVMTVLMSMRIPARYAPAITMDGNVKSTRAERSVMNRKEAIRYGKHILEDIKEMPKPSEGYNQKRIGAQETLLSNTKLVEDVVIEALQAPIHEANEHNCQEWPPGEECSGCEGDKLREQALTLLTEGE